MPAMPMAESSPPMVVGISVTSSADEHGTASRCRRNRRRRPQSVTTAIRKISVRPDEQDGQRDLVRRLLPLGALDQGDHAVEEGLRRRSR